MLRLLLWCDTNWRYSGEKKMFCNGKFFIFISLKNVFHAFLFVAVVFYLSHITMCVHLKDSKRNYIIIITLVVGG